MAEKPIFPGVTKLVLEDAGNAWEAEGAMLAIWNGKVEFSVSLMPNDPDGTEALLETALARCRKEYQLELLRECAALLPALRAAIPARMPDLDKRIAALYEAETFRANNRVIQNLFRRDALPDAERCAAILPLLLDNTRLLHPLALPPELRRDDCAFAGALGVIAVQTRTLRDRAEAKNSGADPAFAPAASKYIRVLERILNDLAEGSARLQGLPRTMTVEEAQVVAGLEDALGDKGQPLRRRLAAARKLWRNPLLGHDGRVDCIRTAVELIFERLPNVRKNYPTALEPCVSAVREQLAVLAAEGSAAFAAPLAAEFLDKANEQRESVNLPVLTPTAFAATIRLVSLHIEARETDGGVAITLEGYFTDTGDSFTGRWMCMRRNKNGAEYTLAG